MVGASDNILLAKSKELMINTRLTREAVTTLILSCVRVIKRWGVNNGEKQFRNLRDLINLRMKTSKIPLFTRLTS